jgi:probable F420-dependent oxidoreductase
MKFGVNLGHGARGGMADADYTRAGVEIADEAGFESIWLGEHVVIPRSMLPLYPGTADGVFPYPAEHAMPNPLVWLTFVAARSDRLLLGSNVLVLPHYNPVVLAKQAATLDALSKGRLLLGVGMGWCPEEAAAIGYPFSERASRMEESIAAMRALWSDDESFTGRWTSFAGAACYPKPWRPGGVPILIGGGSPAAARRAGRLGDGFIPAVADADELRPLLRELRESAAVAGRSPDAIEVTCRILPRAEQRGQTLAAVREFEDLGVSRLIVSFAGHTSTAQVRSAIAEFADAVLSAFPA